jgi:hypothetical protein
MKTPKELARRKAVRAIQRAAHTKTCRYCGGPIELKPVGRRPVYCMRKCRRYYNEEKTAITGPI